MLTILIAVGCGLLLALLGFLWLESLIWAVCLFFLGAVIPNVIINLWLRKGLQGVLDKVQNDLAESNADIQRKMGQMQNQMSGASKGMQKQFEKRQTVAIQEALHELDKTEPFFKWNFLAKKQVDTYRAQLLYQIKDYENAKKYFASGIMPDALTMAMKMALCYRDGEIEEVDKLFKKGRKKFKKDKKTILVALYTWILVKTGRIDEAVSILAEEKEETGSQVLEQNWQFLANGKTKQFSNAGLGDQWYALQLENPKPVRQRARGGRKRVR
jgi:tetratricopeptide (TPR) repeat protein